MKLKYFLENNSFEDEFTIRTLLMLAGFNIERSLIPGNADIIYGRSDPESGKLFIIPENGSHSHNDLFQVFKKGSIESKILSADIVYSAKNLLTDRVNNRDIKENYDIHDRLKYNAGYKHLDGGISIPAVNFYMVFLQKWIRKHLGLEHKPDFEGGKKCIIALSHDVDRPVKNQLLRNFSMPSRWGLKERSYHGLRYINAVRHRRSYTPDFDDHIKELIGMESKYGFRSTYFFCSSNMYFPYGSIYDVPYDLSWEDVQKSVMRVLDSGNETGLHASYNSYISPERFIQEKEHLEKITKQEIRGLRHHYWHMGNRPFRTLEYHARAGFSYDSSFAYNEHIGFRLGIAAGFYPMSENNDSVTGCMEIPALCMDGNFDYRRRGYAEKTVSAIEKYISLLKETRGTGALDWHTDTSVPVNKRNPEAAYTYRSVLEMLAADKEILVTNLGKVYDHYAGLLAGIQDFKMGSGK